MAGIRYGLQIHKDAKSDIDLLLESDPSAAAQIVAFLQELSGDNYLLDALTIQEYDDNRISVKKVEKLQRERWNVWRLTLCDLHPPEDRLPYRILYAFDGRARVYHVLAIRHRSIVYDDNTLDRACNACQRLGISPLPRG